MKGITIAALALSLACLVSIAGISTVLGMSMLTDYVSVKGKMVKTTNPYGLALVTEDSNRLINLDLLHDEEEDFELDGFELSEVTGYYNERKNVLTVTQIQYLDE